VNGRTACAALLLLTAACASYDERVFDERLRGATFDAYVRTIDAQFDGLADAGWSASRLRAAYRDAAVEASDPADFYGVLRQVLAELDDPHASLTVSPRFWTGPVAEPEWSQLQLVDDRLMLGVPATSLRRPVQLREDIAAWVDELGAESLADLDRRGIAEFLRMSAAFGSRGILLDRSARIRPLAWVEVASVDGFEVETPHDAELLLRGALGSVATIEVRSSNGALRTLALLRNAGVFELDEERTARRRLDPLALARRLDPRLRAGDAQRGGRLPLAAELAGRRARAASALGVGRRFPLAQPGADAFDVEAFEVVTPAGLRAGYLRIGAFRPDPSALESLGIADASIDPALASPVAHLAPYERWIVDVTGNPGGAWRDAGLFMSYFLPAETETVPHVVRSVRTSPGLLIDTRIIETTLLQRADVRPVGIGREVIVLVDQDTASAGEIVASMLRGTSGAALVGERTAGAEFSTAEFLAPDGSTLRLGLGGGMVPPLESFQGRGLEPDVRVKPGPPAADGRPRVDPEVWRARFRYRALRAALELFDERELLGDRSTDAP